MGPRAASVALVIAAAGCNQVFGLAPADRTDAAVDAATDADEALIDAELGTWNTPVPIAALSTPNDEQDPAVTGDGLELYVGYTATTSATGTDIVVSRRVATNQAWPPPVRVAELSGTLNDMTPRIADQDRAIYISSDRAGGFGGAQDIWRSQRSSNLAAWSLPSVIPDPALNSAANDRTASPCLGGTRFIFSSDRTGAQPDLFELANGIASPIPVASSATIAENSPFVTEDCLTVYFVSNADGTRDLHVMSRTSLTAEFRPPLRIVELASGFEETDPWVSADGRYMVFASNRSGTYDLYEATR